MQSHNLCWHVWQYATAVSWFRTLPLSLWNFWQPGLHYVQSVSRPHWLLLATERQILNWREDILRFVDSDCVVFADGGEDWQRQEESNCDVFCKLLKTTENPAFVWVSPRWLLARVAAKSRNLDMHDDTTIDEPGQRYRPGERIRNSVRVDTGRRCLNLDLGRRLIHHPDPTCSLRLQPVRHDRWAEGPHGQKIRYGSQNLLFAADPSDDATNIELSATPAELEFYFRKDQYDLAPPYMDCFHVIIGRLEPKPTSQYDGKVPVTAWCEYATLSFHPGNGWALNHLFAYRDLLHFVEHYPAFSALLANRLFPRTSNWRQNVPE